MDISNIEIAEEFYRIINDDSYFNAKYKSQEARYSVGFSKDIIKSLINDLNNDDAITKILEILDDPEKILNLTNKDNIRIYNGSIELLKKLLILTKLHHLYNAYKSGKLTPYHHDESLITEFINKNNSDDVTKFPMTFYTYYVMIQREKINDTGSTNIELKEREQMNIVNEILNNINIANIIYEQEIRTDSSIELTITSFAQIQKFINLLNRLSNSYIDSLRILSPKNKYILKKCKHIINKKPNILNVTSITELQRIVSNTDEKILYLGLNLLIENYLKINEAISSIEQRFAGGFNNRKTKRILKRY